MVSVPLRGKKIETKIKTEEMSLAQVSVPLRGKKIETSAAQYKPAGKPAFPSPCGVKKLKPREKRCLSKKREFPSPCGVKKLKPVKLITPGNPVRFRPLVG